MRPVLALAPVLAAALAAFAPVASAYDLPFQPGEEVTLSVRFLKMHAADLKVTVNSINLDGRPVWPLEMHGETRGLFNAVHEVDETFVTYFDPASQASAGWDRQTSVDGADSTEQVRYGGGKAKVRRVEPSKVKNASLDVPPNAHDVLSALYYLRTQPLAVGADVKVPIFTGKKSWNMDGKVLRRETVDVGGQQWDTLVVRCRTHFDGKFASDRDITMWLSADARRVPVKVEADFMIGTMRATIEKYRAGMMAQK